MDIFFSRWSDAEKTQGSDWDWGDFFQYTFLIGSFFGIVFSFYKYTWWILALCTGSSLGLLWRDVEWHRAGCDGTKVEAAYICSQAVAMLAGPFVAWRIMISSKALDRVYGSRARGANWKQLRECCKLDFKNPFRVMECWQGICEHLRMCRSQRLQCFELEVQCDDKEPISLRFFQVWDSQDDDDYFGVENIREERGEASEAEQEPEGEYHSSSESGSGQNPATCDCQCCGCTRPMQGLESGQAANASLIYSKHGDHVSWTGIEIDSEQTILEVKPTEHADIMEAMSHPCNPIILLIRIQATGRRVLLHADSCKCCLSCVETMMPRFLLPLLVVLLAYGWNKCFHHKGGYKESSILLLMLPEVIEKFLNATNATLNATHTGAHRRKTDIATAVGLSWNEVDEVLLQGWNCTSGDRGASLGTHIAVWDTSFFYVACFLFVWIGCYHLYVAAGSLRELTGLLHIHAHDDKHAQAVVLYRLNNIRQQVRDRRALKHVAADAFPDSLRLDQSLAWWFETRAVIFLDAKRSVAKRSLIFGLGMLAELVMIAVTSLAYFLEKHETKFYAMCYASAYSLLLGLQTLTYIYLASDVNSELERGLEEMQTMDCDSDKSPKPKRHLLNKEPDEMLTELLDYESLHPAQLDFLGVPFSFQVAAGYAAPLGTYIVAVVLWIFKKSMGVPSEVGD